MKKILLTALFLLMGTAEMTAQKSAVANGDKWQKIGEKTVNLQSQADEIIIAGPNKFEAVKIQVTVSPILLESFDVHFAGGEKQTVNFGGYDPVKLDGYGERVVTKVTLRYKSIDESDKRAHIEILGLKTNPGSKIYNTLVVR